MKILFLYNNVLSLRLSEWLSEVAKEDVVNIDEKIDLKKLNYINPEFIISYNYKYIIDKNIIKKYNRKAINLHISFLPWNRGAYPNIWSFLCNTKKGVTIHLLDEGIDTGSILVQKEVAFKEKNETLKTTYEKLHDEIQNIFIQNWKSIKNNKLIHQKQIGSSSIHYIKDFNEISFLIEDKGWDISIQELKKRYYCYINNEKKKRT